MKTAVGTYIKRKRKAQKLLTDLVVTVERFQVPGDKPNWGHAGTMGYVVAKLEEIKEMLS
jgi:hypothetical protein